MRRALLTCGIAASLLYAGMNVFIPMQWNEYSSVAQAISELSAIGAPTRPLWVVLGILYALLIAGFGVGIWGSAHGSRRLRVAGGGLLANRGLCLFLPPLHPRGTVFTLTDALHIGWTVVTVALMMIAMGFAAGAFGRRFRVFSIAAIVLSIGFGALTALNAPRVAAGLGTPWMGLWERLSVAGSLSWVVVLAVAMLGRRAVPMPGGRPAAAVPIHGSVAPGFEDVRTAFERNFAERGEIGAAVAAYWCGEKVVDLWGGYRTPERDAPWEADTMVAVASTTKGLAAMTLALAHSRGWLDYDAPVAGYWPEFAQNGKADITVRQLLRHEAGLVLLDQPITVDSLRDLDGMARLPPPQRPRRPPGPRPAAAGRPPGPPPWLSHRHDRPLHAGADPPGGSRPPQPGAFLPRRDRGTPGLGVSYRAAGRRSGRPDRAASAPLALARLAGAALHPARNYPQDDPSRLTAPAVVPGAQRQRQRPELALGRGARRQRGRDRARYRARLFLVRRRGCRAGHHEGDVRAAPRPTPPRAAPRRAAPGRGPGSAGLLLARVPQAGAGGVLRLEPASVRRAGGGRLLRVRRSRRAAGLRLRDEQAGLLPAERSAGEGASGCVVSRDWPGEGPGVGCPDSVIRGGGRACPRPRSRADRRAVERKDDLEAAAGGADRPEEVMGERPPPHRSNSRLRLSIPSRISGASLASPSGLSRSARHASSSARPRRRAIPRRSARSCGRSANALRTTRSSAEQMRRTTSGSYSTSAARAIISASNGSPANPTFTSTPLAVLISSTRYFSAKARASAMRPS